jgi:L-glyceraldehyde 3-phosphate reductase
MQRDLAPFRDELVISTKAGYDMWPGPYGEWLPQVPAGEPRPEPRAVAATTSTSSTRTASTPTSPLEETMERSTLRCGGARRSTPASRPRRKGLRGAAISATSDRSIHQPSYDAQPLIEAVSTLWARSGEASASPAGPGPPHRPEPERKPRASRPTCFADLLSEQTLEKVRALQAVAAARVRPWRRWHWPGRCTTTPTSTLIGASSVGSSR